MAYGTALLPERGRRARGAEQLDDGEPPAGGVEPLEMPGQLVYEDRELPSEGDRDGRLCVRATRHHRRAMLACQPCEPVTEGARENVDSVKRTGANEREARVHDVLGRRTPVQVAGGGVGLLAQLLEQGQNRVTDDPRPLVQAYEIDVLGHRDRVDGGDSLTRNDPVLRLGRRKRALDLEPGADERRLREATLKLLVAEHVDERQEHHTTLPVRSGGSDPSRECTLVTHDAL